MPDTSNQQNNFFISVWVIFFLVLIAYSVYLNLVSGELALHPEPDTDQIVPFVSFRMITGLFFVIAVFNIKKITGKKLWVPLIITTGIVTRIILIPSSPVLENDYFRYLWDGAVTANGINPFYYSPADAMSDSSEIPLILKELSTESGEVIKNINYPHIRTIYPVLSQGVFAISYLIAPWQVWVWKLVLLFFDLVLLTFLILILREVKLPIALLSVYWLNPVVIHEFFNSGHMDLPALTITAASLYAFLKKRHCLSIILLALAAAFKLWPVVLLPLLLRNLWNQKRTLLIYLTGFGIIVFVLYIPVIAAGINESLGLIKYAESWINNAAFYTIFRELFHWLVALSGLNFSFTQYLPRIGIAFLYLILLFFIVRKDSDDKIFFLERALLIVAVLFLISPTQFPWYYTWMVPMLVLRPRASLLLYAILLPMYNLKYLSPAFVYMQHLPVIAAFVWELISRKTCFVLYPEVSEKNFIDSTE